MAENCLIQWVHDCGLELGKHEYISICLNRLHRLLKRCNLPIWCLCICMIRINMEENMIICINISVCMEERCVNECVCIWVWALCAGHRVQCPDDLGEEEFLSASQFWPHRNEVVCHWKSLLPGWWRVALQGTQHCINRCQIKGMIVVVFLALYWLL